MLSGTPLEVFHPAEAMANATPRTIPGFSPWDQPIWRRRPRGWSDAATPFSPALGDTAGTLGINDWAVPEEILKQTAPSRRFPLHKGDQGTSDPDSQVSQRSVTLNTDGDDSPDSRYLTPTYHDRGSGGSDDLF